MATDEQLEAAKQTIHATLSKLETDVIRIAQKGWTGAEAMELIVADALKKRDARRETDKTAKSNASGIPIKQSAKSTPPTGPNTKQDSSETEKP